MRCPEDHPKQRSRHVPTPDASRRARERRPGRAASGRPGPGAGSGSTAAAAHHRLRRAPGRLRHGRRRHRRAVGGRAATRSSSWRSRTATRGTRPRAAARSRSAGDAEAQEAGRRYGIAEYEVLDNHDGELEPTLAVRQQVIRRIRQWQADLVIAPRPNDYHPDHRYTGVVVQDAAYMVVVPNVLPDTPAAAQEPRVHLLAATASSGRTRSGPTWRSRSTTVIDKKLRRARRAHARRCTSGCPGSTGSSTACRRSRPRGLSGCASSAAESRSPTTCAPRCASGTAPAATPSRTPRPSRSASTAAGRASPTCGGCFRSSTDAPPRGSGGAAAERPRWPSKKRRHAFTGRPMPVARLTGSRIA